MSWARRPPVNGRRHARTSRVPDELIEVLPPDADIVELSDRHDSVLTSGKHGQTPIAAEPRRSTLACGLTTGNNGKSPPRSPSSGCHAEHGDQTGKGAGRPRHKRGDRGGYGCAMRCASRRRHVRAVPAALRSRQATWRRGRSGAVRGDDRRARIDAAAPRGGRDPRRRRQRPRHRELPQRPVARLQDERGHATRSCCTRSRSSRRRWWRWASTTWAMVEYEADDALGAAAAVADADERVEQVLIVHARQGPRPVRAAAPGSCSSTGASARSSTRPA